jgi:hypothetical protein
MSDTVPFYLPLGLEKSGTLLRRGTMHSATTGDELTIQSAEETAMNSRYRDILLLATVIDDLEGIKPERADIENLYEADFLYLQLLYRQINSPGNTSIQTVCPNCGQKYNLVLSRLYENVTDSGKKGDA